MDLDHCEDIEMFNKLQKLVVECPIQFANRLRASTYSVKSAYHEKQKLPYRRLYSWLMQKTKMLDTKSSITQRVHWVLNKLNDFPKCKVCGKPIKDPSRFKTLTTGYSPFCSVKCGKKSGADLSTKLKREANNGNYFSEETRRFLSENARKRARDQDVIDKMKAGIERRFGKGIENAFQAKAVKEKSKKTKLERYGDPYWNNYEQATKTYEQKHGLTRGQAFLKRIRKTMQEKYSVDHPCKVKEIVRKARQTRMNRTSIYSYMGLLFDSWPEVCFYIWAVDNGLHVEREPHDKILVYRDGKGQEHQYFPDFFVKEWNRLVEIKEDNHFEDNDPEKSMISFKGPENNHIEEAKQNCMIQHNVILFTTKQYDVFQKYVRQRYGKQLQQTCRLHSMQQCMKSK